MFSAGRQVALQSFFFIDIQSLCHIPSKPEQKYLPCELAVVKYSISEGVISKLHCFIKPGAFVNVQIFFSLLGSEECITVKFPIMLLSEVPLYKSMA